MATNARGGQAALVKPKKPGSDAAWLKAHPGWKQRTQARWAANHPQPLFPSTDISNKELGQLLSSARSSVTKTYDATPLPSVQQYLQPFADAQARNQGYAANYDAYLQQAAAASQNISGAFNTALTGGVNAGAANVASQGGSGQAGAIPTASQALTPMAMTGSSFTQYLNAERPYVQSAANASSAAINTQQAAALQDYRDTEAKRRAEIQDAIQQLYKSNVDTLQGRKDSREKAAVTEFLALGKTAYQKQQLSDRRAQSAAQNKLKQGALDVSRDKLNETKAYHQAQLDKTHKAALAKGIDLSAAYRTMFAGGAATTAKGGDKVGRDGQRGRWYTITPLTKLASGGTLTGTPTRTFVKYGEKVPQSIPDKQKVLAGDFEYPPKSSATTNRKVTQASWDRALAQLKAKYPGRITAAWMKSVNYPPRPAK